MDDDRRPLPTVGLRLLATVAVVVAVASPAVRQRDSYPLSTYPVYASARPGVDEIHTAVGVTDDGRRVRLSLPMIGDSDDPLIVEDRVADAVAARRTDRLCLAIAGRARGAGLTAIEVATEQVDLVATAADGAPPLARTVHATCPVTP